MIGIIDLGIQTLKELKFGGISLYTGIQFIFWGTAVIGYILPFFISRVGGGGSD